MHAVSYNTLTPIHTHQYTHTDLEAEVVEIMDGYDEVFQHPNLVSIRAEKTLPVHQEPNLLQLRQEPADCCTLQYAEHERRHH